MELAPLDRVNPASLKYPLLALTLFAVVATAPAQAPGADELTAKTDQPLNLAKAMPVKEVCLMLRGGYTSGEVLAEVDTRRLLEPVDAAAEAQLKTSGATPALINALKTGNYNLSATDAATARERQAAISQKEQASRQAAAAAAPASPAQPVSAVPAAGVARPNVVAGMLHGQLVSLRDGSLQPFGEKTLSGTKYFLWLFASSTAPDQKFIAPLVDFYGKLRQAHPEVEMILYSKDKSAEAMSRYVQSNRMPWPAVAYDKRAQLSKLGPFAVGDPASLLLVDDTGAVLASSLRDGKFSNPADVIQNLMTRLDAPAK